MLLVFVSYCPVVSHQCFLIAVAEVGQIEGGEFATEYLRRKREQLVYPQQAVT
jgi:hypothetical protein